MPRLTCITDGVSSRQHEPKRATSSSPQAADGTSQHHPTPSKHLYAHRHPATEKMVTYRQEMVAQGRPIEQGSCTGNRG